MIKLTVRFWGLFVLWLALMGSATAQQEASADQLIAAARGIAQQIDTDRAGEAWDASSPALRSRLPRERFVADARAGRQAFAAVSTRSWSSVSRLRYDKDGDVPTGRYVNVTFTTLLADGSTMLELVSLRQEADGLWHMMGYVPRRPQ